MLLLSFEADFESDEDGEGAEDDEEESELDEMSFLVLSELAVSRARLRVP